MYLADEMHCVLQILPLSLDAFLDAPVPFVAGVPRGHPITRRRNKASQIGGDGSELDASLHPGFEHLYLVDLDDNTLRVSAAPSAHSCPGKAAPPLSYPIRMHCQLADCCRHSPPATGWGRAPVPRLRHAGQRTSAARRAAPSGQSDRRWPCFVAGRSCRASSPLLHCTLLFTRDFHCLYTHPWY